MILVINAGSSSVKFALYETENLTLIHKSIVKDLDAVFSWLEANKSNYEITAVGHRIVHGGTTFFDPVILDVSIVDQLKQLIPLAPLHQPYNLSAVEYIFREYPDIIQIGCFDTAFHRTQHKLAKLFAIPNKLTAAGVIRYGFHGISYEYIADIIQTEMQDLANKKVIVAHLGNGASMCAMQDCRSVATSMGFSALDGLMMGTRTGSIDPGVLLYLLQEQNYSNDQLTDLLYHKSGLLGVSEISNDVSELLKSDAQLATTALDLFCYKAATEFGKLAIALQGCDALIFTAGIGENAAVVRSGICKWLEYLGVELNTEANALNSEIISSIESKILVAVIRTDEEYMLAMHVIDLI